MVLNDRTLGVAALLLSAFLAWFGHGLEAAFAYEPVGPRAFPLLLATVIGMCGLRLVVKGGNPAAPNPPGANSRIALMVALVLVYAGLFQWTGFVLATAVAAACVGRLFGGSWLQCGIGGTSLSVLFYVLFDRLLDVVLPLGWLEELL
ncbi:tripartite tricarboxylate transporter TctB family protein [Comamonas sp. B-9]|uniref:tripartite tricarboxylate transporter TctB family protein n=1 Tax=Comamonas sp. B-9 TaxID=1055192 RepID=UPI000395651D|nr:tripartite tricarboxylate transporter TctB family protein [Comamonas sp. B-9]